MLRAIRLFLIRKRLGLPSDFHKKLKINRAVYEELNVLLMEAEKENKENLHESIAKTIDYHTSKQMRRLRNMEFDADKFLNETLELKRQDILNGRCKEEYKRYICLVPIKYKYFIRKYIEENCGRHFFYHENPDLFTMLYRQWEIIFAEIDEIQFFWEMASR